MENALLAHWKIHIQNLHIKLTCLQNPNPRAFFVLRSAFVWLLSSRPTLVPSALAQINSAWHSLYSSISRLLVDCLWNFAPCSMVWVNSLSRWVLGLIPRMWKSNRRKFWLQNIHEFNKCRWMCLATINPSARVQLRTRFGGKAWCGPPARALGYRAAGNFLAGKMTSPDRGLDLSVCLSVWRFVCLSPCWSVYHFCLRVFSLVVSSLSALCTWYVNYTETWRLTRFTVLGHNMAHSNPQATCAFL